MDIIVISLIAMWIMTGLCIVICFLGITCMLLIFLDIFLGKTPVQRDWVNEERSRSKGRHKQDD